MKFMNEIIENEIDRHHISFSRAEKNFEVEDPNKILQMVDSDVS